MAGKAGTGKSKAKTSGKAPLWGQDEPATVKSDLVSRLDNTGITPDERSQMIEEMAYYRAEQRGFGPEGHLDDWLEAESIVDTMLSKSAHDTEKLSH